MTFTLRVRLVGPMQSWGTRSRFDIRDTESVPSKSGVIGLVAAASGLTRDHDVTHLAALRMGVRTDNPGVRMRDYHTALDVVGSDGKAAKNAVVSKRDYLADAAFLVGLESPDRSLLENIQWALLDPKWPLALGRRAFPPSAPVAFSGPGDPAAIVASPLEQALIDCAPLKPVSDDFVFRYHIEDEAGDQEWFDQPTDNFRNRSFRGRRVKVASAKWGVSWY